MHDIICCPAWVLAFCRAVGFAGSPCMEPLASIWVMPHGSVQRFVRPSPHRLIFGRIRLDVPFLHTPSGHGGAAPLACAAQSYKRLTSAGCFMCPIMPLWRPIAVQTGGEICMLEAACIYELSQLMHSLCYFSRPTHTSSTGPLCLMSWPLCRCFAQLCCNVQQQAKLL